jgi:hypothetical protein
MKTLFAATLLASLLLAIVSIPSYQFKYTHTPPIVCRTGENCAIQKTIIVHGLPEWFKNDTFQPVNGSPDLSETETSVQLDRLFEDFIFWCIVSFALIKGYSWIKGRKPTTR